MNKNSYPSRWKKTAISAAVAVAAASFTPMVIAATCTDSPTICIDDVRFNETYNLGSDDSITITNTGALMDGASYSGVPINVYSTATGAVINNNGSIWGFDNPAIYVNNGAVDTEITNNLVIGATDASAVVFNGNFDGVLTNNSVISAEGSSNPTVEVYGVYAAGDMVGTLTNNGTISASATSTFSATAAGVRISGGMMSGASITNNGLIEAEASNAWYANAAGIRTGSLAGGSSWTSYSSLQWTDGASITNSNTGTITVTATGSSADAYGIRVESMGSADGSNSGARITNSGTINVTANATDSEADAYGIRVNEGMGDWASITNNGSISATAISSYSSAGARGINTGSLGANANITNNGTITAEATVLDATGSYSAYAVGIRTGDLNSSASIDNNGTINATAKSYGTSGSAYAYGIRAGDMGGSASISNISSGEISAETSYAMTLTTMFMPMVTNGIIDVEAISTYGFAKAEGIRALEMDSYASIENSGTIMATATGYQSATANGIKVDDMGAWTTTSSTTYGIYGYNSTGASIANSGEITVTANAEYGTANAYGILVGDETYSGGINAGSLGVNASISNSGTINATAQTSYSGSAAANAYGIYTGHLYEDASIENSGTITADASAVGYDNDAYVYGIRTGDLNGASIANTNIGSISATATATYGAAVAVGIRAEVLRQGASITNDGTISAEAVQDSSTSYFDAYAFGIQTQDLADGIWVSSTTYTPAYLSNTASITNNGKIEAWAHGGDSTAKAVGIETGYLGEGASISNHGTITAEASDADYATAYGINAFGGLGNWASISNTGSIGATAMSYGSTARAVGIYVEDGTLGADASISNSGTITARAEATDSDAQAYGIRTGNLGARASISNEGSIIATAISTAWWTGARAYGIRAIDLSDDASISNSGTIAASAFTYSSGPANAYGIRAGSLGFNASINNSGTITAEASATYSGAAAAYGVYASSLGSTSSITNSGIITATAKDRPSDGYSVYVESGSGMVYNNGIMGGNDYHYLGGVLNGNLYLGGSVSMENTGKLSIPAGATGYINGDYTQSGNGVLETRVLSDESYGQLHVNGEAYFDNGRFNVKVMPDYDLEDGDVLEKVLAAGSDTLYSTPPYSVTDNALLWNFSAAINPEDDNAIDIGVIDTGITSLAGAAAGTSGEGAAGVLDGWLADAGLVDGLLPDQVPEGQMGDIVQGLLGFGSQAEARDAIAQVLPMIDGGMGRVTLDAMHAALGELDLHIENSLSGASSGDLLVGDRRFWLKPFGSWSDQDSSDGASGYSADTYGLMIGADGAASETTRVGVAFAYSRTDVDNDDTPQNADIDSYQAMVYGSHSLDQRTNVNVKAGLGFHKNDSRRTINFLGTNYRATADYDGWSGHAGISLARVYDIGEKTTFTPSVHIEYARIREEGYSESGSSLLTLKNVGSVSTDELILGVDGKFKFALDTNKFLTANLGAGYDALADRDSITASFVGGGSSFRTNGVDPSKWLVHGGLGLVLNSDSNVEVIARYDIEAREDFTNQTASLKVKIPF